jgi:hypothetical protein
LVPFLYLHIHLGDARSNFGYSLKVEDSLKALFNGEEGSLVCGRAFVGDLGLKVLAVLAMHGDVSL